MNKINVVKICTQASPHKPAASSHIYAHFIACLHSYLQNCHSYWRVWDCKRGLLTLCIEMKVRQLILFGAVLTCLFPAILPAQQPSFIHYSLSDGLPSNLIYSMTQDAEGFLWFATDKGLARFDNLRFHTFDMNDGLPDMEILNIKKDARNRLWISPFRQHPCFWEKGEFHTTQNDTILQKIELYGAAIDCQPTPDGWFWLFGMGNGAGTPVYYLKGDTVNGFYFNDNAVGVYYYGSETFLISPDKILKIQKDDSLLPVFSLSAIYGPERKLFGGAGYSDSLLLFSFEDRLILLKYSAGQFKMLDQMPYRQSRVNASEPGKFWVSTSGGGAVLMDCRSGKIVPVQRYLNGEKVNFVYQDYQKTLWFCTLDNGVFGLPLNTPLNFQKDAHFTSSNITAVAIDANGRTVAGDDEGKLYFISGTQVNHLSLGDPDGYNRVLRIISRPADKSLYIASDEGIFQLQNQHLRSLLANSTPKEICFRGNEMWSANANQVGFYNETFDKFHFIFNNRRHTSVCVDNEGYVWAGGTDGLYSLVDSFKSNWSDRFPLLKGRIVTLHQGGRGYIWVVTPQYGLMKVHVDKGHIRLVEIMNEKLPYPVNNIKCLFSDDKNNLWMGTNRGAYRMAADNSLIHLDKHDGLANDDINSLAVADDTLWVGTSKGLTRIQLVGNTHDWDFPTLVTGIEYRDHDRTEKLFIGNQDQAMNGMSFSQEVSFIQIILSGLDFTSRGNIRFSYLQEEQFPPLQWLTIGNMFSLLFSTGNVTQGFINEGKIDLGTHLRPGKYKFTFTAVNTRGEQSNHPGTIVIFQKPNWYETIWFWLAMLVTAFLIIRRIYQNQLAWQDLNASVSRFRLQALQAQMNPHFIGNSIYAIQQFFYPPDPEKASEYIEIFNRMLRQSMEMSEHHFVEFSEELTYYRDYLKMAQLRYGDRFKYEITVDPAISMTTPFPAMMLQPVIENATIHGLSPKGQSLLKLDFRKAESSLICVVEDNGAGIDTTRAEKKQRGEKRQSRGLAMVQQKINTLNRLYQTDIELLFEDLSAKGAGASGTRATLHFNPTLVQQTNPEKIVSS